MLCSLWLGGLQIGGRFRLMHRDYQSSENTPHPLSAFQAENSPPLAPRGPDAEFLSFQLTCTSRITSKL